MVPVLSITILLPIFSAPTKTTAFAIFPGAVLSVILAVVLIRTYRRTARQFHDFRIVLSGRLLKRSLPGREDIYIASSDVSRVIIYPGNGCSLEGLKGQPALWIPATLLGYDELMRTVQSWSIPEIRTAFWTKNWFIYLMTAAMMAAILFVIQAQKQDRALATAVGIPLAAYFSWTTSTLPRNPHASERLKRMAGIMWLGVGIIILKIVVLWFA